MLPRTLILPEEAIVNDQPRVIQAEDVPKGTRAHHRQLISLGFSEGEAWEIVEHEHGCGDVRMPQQDTWRSNCRTSRLGPQER